MKPVGYTTSKGKVTYHYKFSDLRKFVTQGNATGDVGAILMGREGLLLSYKSYGTIEHPLKERVGLSMMHNPNFDGRLPTDEEIVKPPVSAQPALQSYEFFMIDLSK